MTNFPYKLIVFDWDGTLMDSVCKIVASMKTAALRAGVDLPTEEQARSIIGKSLHPAVAELFSEHSSDTHEKIATLYRQVYLYEDETPTPLFCGVIELCHELRSIGVQLAVATGKAREGLNQILDSLDIHHLFEVTVCGDEFESKPSPEMLNYVLQKAGVEAKDSLMVGDSPLDIDMAHAAGLDSIAVTCGAHTAETLAGSCPTHIFEGVTELSEWIRAS